MLVVLTVTTVDFRFLVLSLAVSLTNGQGTCTDAVDSSICRLLASESFGLKTVCTDPCLAKTCQKTCGKCPLQCYSCHSVTSPSDCTTLTTCPSGDHKCIVTESYNDDFVKTYALGCALENVCQNNFGGTTGKRSVLDGSCCSTDLCNYNISSITPPLAGIILTTPAAVVAPDASIAPAPVATTRGPCADFNNELCTQLAFAMPDICTNDCIATKVCPSMCGKCLSCFNCDNVNDPSACTSTVTCNPGQRCYITETYNSLTFEHGFRTGCIDDKLCSNLTVGGPVDTVGPALIGRRSHFHFSLDGDCCASDFCNDRIQTTVAPVVTTPAPVGTMQPSGPSVTNSPGGPMVTSQPGGTNVTPNPQGCSWSGDCPPGFHPYQGKCYNFGDVEMEWDDALGYCKQRCSYLAELKTEDQLEAVMNHFRKNPNTGYDHIADYYIGAFDKGIGIWTWFNSGEMVSTDIVDPDYHEHTIDQCAVAMEVSVGAPLDRDFAYVAAPCTELYRPMCEVLRQ
ncbi:uncharacterized protein LOC132543812 [Ylistrum balloti]|uniref:uncharacterized protein LOC132543812 n=1 Tax=Ylistrum balloti TaxID=509963 RepID=UPI002905F3FE|nr:uncharacterized protein LOC132543812 [Ylistrum balloti]